MPRAKALAVRELRMPLILGEAHSLIYLAGTSIKLLCFRGVKQVWSIHKFEMQEWPLRSSVRI